MIYICPVSPECASGAFYAQRAFYVSPAKLKSDYSAVRFERELRLFRAWCPEGTVLDVGCSNGAFLHQLNSRFPGAYNVLGQDVAGLALNYAESRGVPVCRDSFLELDVGKRRFDAITFWAVLEHLEEPRAFLSRAAEMLRPGGHCFILTPNFQSLAVRLLGKRYRYIMPEHLNYFTPRTLAAFGANHDKFQVVAAGSMHFNPMVIWQDFFWSQRLHVPDEERAQLLQRTTAWKQRRAFAPLRALYSVIESVLGTFDLADNIYIVLRRSGEGSSSAGSLG
jgi:2-polyprenyl-3-methyl-5-hydroxy-6-metoxy-1,4-benzoquinol methylase